MRKKKHPQMKAMHVMVTMNPTLHDVLSKQANKEGLTLSGYLTELATEDIIGISLADLEFVYGHRDIRHKRDPLEKEQVRILRWITESKIYQVITIDGSIYVRVQWVMNGTDNWVRIDNNYGLGFTHVIYDEALDSLPTEGERLDGIPGDVFNGFNEFKKKVMTYWFSVNNIGNGEVK